MWEVHGDLDVSDLWDVSTRDQRALTELRKKEDALARQQRGRSPSPRRVKEGPRAVPAQDDRWDSDDLQPLGRGGKGMEKTKASSKNLKGA